MVRQATRNVPTYFGRSIRWNLFGFSSNLYSSSTFTRPVFGVQLHPKIDRTAQQDVQTGDLRQNGLLRLDSNRPNPKRVRSSSIHNRRASIRLSIPTASIRSGDSCS